MDRHKQFVSNSANILLNFSAEQTLCIMPAGDVLFTALQIRKAQTEEAETLTAIAIAAKRYWGYPENWIEHWRDELTITPEFVNQHDVFVAEENNRVLGFYALIVKNEKAELDHLWVAPEDIGRGVGKELFLHAMDRASHLNVGEVEIYSDPNAESFYSKLGAVKDGELSVKIDNHDRVIPRLKIDPRKPQI
jgi:N-acetylglutamate synthase-like GNAT family acetyltransferase